ncbi:MAG: phosphoadenylyl-sulfate reductase [Terriglobales bacterium]|jgi:phosphoadenosine phosphosulfate reductase
MNDQIAEIRLIAESWSPQQVLAWAFETFGDSVAIASAFGAEGMVLIDMASRLRKKFRVFTLDTEFLFPETYSLMDRIEQKYEIRVERVFSLLPPEEQERVHGAALWARNPDQCCNLRKVEPLRRKLSGLSAWITSIRRDQTAARQSARKIEMDEKSGLVKLNPVADWNSQQVWQYLLEHDVPYNSLHDKNYPSIGCIHCTRAVLPGEDPRAGRWSGSNKTECGLHRIEPLPAFPAVDA